MANHLTTYVFAVMLGLSATHATAASPTASACMVASASLSSLAVPFDSPSAAPEQSWKNWKKKRRGHRHRGNGGSTAATPEPATIVMMILSLLGILGGAWILRRKRTIA